MKDVKPWEIPGVPFNTESKFWSHIRGIMRKGWSRFPVKLEFIKKYRIKVDNPNPNGRNEKVWGMKCASCGGEFSLPVAKKVRTKIEALTGEKFNYIEINHKTQAGSLKTKDDLGRFAANMFYVNFDDLEPQCKICHGEITHSEKFSLTIEEAKLEKQVIAIMKDKNDKSWLTDKGITPGKNAKIRKQQIIDYLNQEELKNGNNNT